jgi:hypothetical protein
MELMESATTVFCFLIIIVESRARTASLPPRFLQHGLTIARGAYVPPYNRTA